MSKLKSNVEGLIKHLTKGYVGVQNDEIEPGNRPLILYVSAAYSILTIQSITYYEATGFDYSGFNFIREAMTRSMKPAGTDSKLYWGYQTSDGQSYWAEGQYYFKLTFDRVFPFWHALRINGITPLYYSYSDPFFSQMVKGPMEWMAQTYEPGGFTAPIDDGNKSLINSSSHLRWSSEYGNQDIGRRYSHIASEINPLTNGVGLDQNMRRHELSVPRTLLKTPPASKWGNTNAIPSEGGKQEIVFRFTDNSNRQHFVYLNGEVGNAIIRGEGHEQPDQLHILYSVDENSYLMDSGYDQVESGDNVWDYVAGQDFNRSKWNNYRDHNVLLTYPPWISKNQILPNPEPNLLGGLKHPERHTGDTRAVSNHTSVSELYYHTNVPNNVDVAHGKILLGSTNMDGHWHDDVVEHQRSLLFIKDPNNPYLIDISMAYTVKWTQPAFFMNVFHGNSNKLPLNLENSNYTLWTEIDGQLDNNLYIYSDNVEGRRVTNTPAASTFYNDTVEEKFRDTLEIKRLNLYTQDPFDLDLDANESTNVSFIKAIIGIEESNLLSNPSTLSPPSRYLTTNQRKASQLYTWNIDSNTKDILIVRSGYIYNSLFIITPQELAVTIENLNLVLPANKDYGFVRLINMNGYWVIHPDYQLNIIHNGHFYTTSDQSIGDSTFPADSEVYVANNLTLTITGHAQFNPGTTVTLGTNASIVVSGSGKITSNGTTFTSVDPSNPALAFNRIELNTSGNSFTNSTFKGGNNQNVLVKKVGNTFTSCTFSHSKVGLSLFTVAAEAILFGSTITQNTQHGAYVDGGMLHLKGYTRVLPSTPSWLKTAFDPTSIHGNSGNGVTLMGTGVLYMHNTRIIDNTGTQVSVGNDARMYTHTFNNQSETGHNRISKTTSGYYIYSTARTVSGETFQSWTINASYNFWGGGSEPVAGRFFGPVNSSNKLTADTTFPWIIEEEVPCVGTPEECLGKTVKYITFPFLCYPQLWLVH